MYEPMLPQGDAAALMPGASYSVPGLFLYADLVYEALDQVKAKFDYDIPVKYIYGSPQVRWNCGRPVLIDHGYTDADLETELRKAVDRGITPLLPFSAPELTPADLEDPRGNYLLSLLDKLGGGVIVVNDLLEAHIRKNYPNIQLHASVIMTCYGADRTPDYYQDLSDRYDRYVVHPDDNFEPELLEQLPRKGAEIMVNERCVYHCHQRGEHYLSNHRDQIAMIEGRGEFEDFLTRCPFVPDFKQQTTKGRNASLTARECQEIRAMGYDLFKLQGRLDIPYAFFFDFFRYTLENEVAFPAMYAPFCFAIRNHLKATEKKRREKRG